MAPLVPRLLAATLVLGTACGAPASTAGESSDHSELTAAQTGSEAEEDALGTPSERELAGEGVAYPVGPVATVAPEQHAVVILTEEESSEGDIDDLLSGALGSSSSRSAGGEAGQSTPSRADVIAAMAEIRPRLDGCASAELDGTAQLRMRFSGTSGNVLEVTVLPETLPAPLRSCLAQAARGAHVPRFREASFAVTFPVRY